MNLSESGKLYLQDYAILTQAKQDADLFLNYCNDQIYEGIAAGVSHISVENFVITYWTNQSSKGTIEIYFTHTGDHPSFRKGKPDIQITYKDIRHFVKMPDPTMIRINTFTPKVARQAKQAIEATCSQFNMQTLFKKEFVQIDSDNLEESLGQVVDVILERVRGVVRVLERL